MFENERVARAYSPYVYWMVTSVAQVPWLCSINVVFSTTIYWAIGLGQIDNAGWIYLWYILITQLTNQIGFAMAQLLASVCSTPAVAMAIWQPQVYIFSQTSGFPIQKPELEHYNPAWVLMTVSFTRWAYQAIIMGVFGDGWGDVYSRSYIMGYYGFENCPLWVPVPILVFYVVAIRAATYYPLREPKATVTMVGHDQFATILQTADEKAGGANRDGRDAGASLAIQPRKANDLPKDMTSPSATDGSLRAVTVSVHDMHYSVKLVNDDTGEETIKPLVRGISITVEPGQIMAVMGPSGAGKSTFLDLIAGRKTTGFGSGQILYNNTAPTFAERAETEAYVMQVSARVSTKRCRGLLRPTSRSRSASVGPGPSSSLALTPVLTQPAVLLTRALTCPAPPQHDVMVNTLTVYETLKISAMLRLRMPSNTAVADRVQTMLEVLGLESVADKLLGGLSAGQRRLVSVAVEAVHMPSVLYLDEPTSGG